MELLGNKLNPHTRPLPGRWTPFQNLMARCHFPCTKCSTDTISMTSEVQYDGLVNGSSTPHTSRGYQADVSNLSSSSEERRTDISRLNQGFRHESVITDSDLPPSRSNNHLGLVFSPRRRAQLSRQQLSWMQALSKNNINTPPSLRDATFLQGYSDAPEQETSNGTTSHSPESTSPEPQVSPPQSPGSNFSTEQTRVSITQHLLTDPSSEETDQSLLQSTIVDVYSLQNGNTMFNLDERNNIYNGSAHSHQSSNESIAFNLSENNLSLNHEIEEQTASPQESPQRLTACNDISETVYQNPVWQNPDVSLSENVDETSNPDRSNAGNFSRNIWSEDTSCDDCDLTHDVSNATDETTIGTSQESAEETVLLDYSENFTFNPMSSQNDAHTTAEVANESVSEQQENANRENESDSDHSESQNNADSSSERNLPVHLISLFENPMSSSDSRSVTSSSNTQTENQGRNGSMYHDSNSRNIAPADGTCPPRHFPRLDHNALNPSNQDRWATRIIRSNLTNSQSSRYNSHTVRSNSSGASSQTQLQNWYVYDPRLVPGNRELPRLNLEMHYRGIQQLWSVPAIVGPPDYDDLSTLQSENGDATRPSGPPPPYMAGSIPPPTYDEAIFDSLFADDDFLGLDNPVYVDPSPPPTISDSSPSLSGGNFHSPSALPCEVVLQQLEHVLNLNSNSPLQSPGDTLTSCATQQSQSLCDDLSENITNSTQSVQRSGQTSPTNRHGISSISSCLRNEQSLENSANTGVSQNAGHSVPLQSLRSALSAHLQALHNNAPLDTGSDRRTRQTRNPTNAILAGSHRSAGNIESYFNRPAIMYNRTVWSESHTRNNFGLGNRLSTFNSSPDVSQIH